MRESDDEHRDDDRPTAEPSATRTPVLGRMLANPRRVRRA